MALQGIWENNRIGDPAYLGFTLGGILDFSAGGDFLKADYPGLRAIRVGDEVILAVDLPATYPIDPAGGGGSVRSFATTVKYTASGSFTKATYPGLAAVIVECQGGGGAGGGAPTTAAGQSSYGQGGNAGGYAKSLILAADLDTSEAVTVGEGGTGAAGTTGSNGTDSVFDTISGEVRGVGGTGGAAIPAAATDAVTGPVSTISGGTGDLVVPGGVGGISVRQTATARGGNGGNSHLGAGGPAAGDTQNAGQGYGAGGSGASRNPSLGQIAGGAGAPGVVIVHIYTDTEVPGAGGVVELWY
jgi:hypothetical protein